MDKGSAGDGSSSSLGVKGSGFEKLCVKGFGLSDSRTRVREFTILAALSNNVFTSELKTLFRD